MHCIYHSTNKRQSYFVVLTEEFTLLDEVTFVFACKLNQLFKITMITIHGDRLAFKLEIFTILSKLVYRREWLLKLKMSHSKKCVPYVSPCMLNLQAFCDYFHSAWKL